MLFEKKKKPITNAAELKDFKLFKDKPAPKKKNALDIDPEDIVDVDVVVKKEAAPEPVVETPKEDSEDATTFASTSEKKENDDTETPSPASPFAKKAGKPSIKLGAKQDKVAPAEKTKKPLFSFGKSTKKEEVEKKEKPSVPLKQKDSSGAKPYNLLSIVLGALALAALTGGVLLQNKSNDVKKELNSVQIGISTTSAEVESVLPKVAQSIDANKSIDVVQLMTRAQLLTLPNSDLSFEADLKESHFYLNYFIKDSADQYDFSKFNEAEFPAFGTGQFSTCKTNNELIKQGEKDAFAIHVKC